MDLEGRPQCCPVILIAYIAPQNLVAWTRKKHSGKILRQGPCLDGARVGPFISKELVFGGLIEWGTRVDCVPPLKGRIDVVCADQHISFCQDR